MKKVKATVARNGAELAKALGLSEADGMEFELRRQLNDKIVDAVKKAGLTHVEVAKMAGTSRTRLTAIMNRNRQGVSTDLMVRILGALGWKTKVGFSRVGKAA